METTPRAVGRALHPSMDACGLAINPLLMLLQLVLFHFSLALSFTWPPGHLTIEGLPKRCGPVSEHIAFQRSMSRQWE